MKARLSLTISIAATMLWSCQFNDVLSTPSNDGVIRVTSSLTKTESASGTTTNSPTTNDNFKNDEIIFVWADKTSSTDDYIKAWKLTAKDANGNFSGESKAWPYDGSSLNFHALHGNFTEYDLNNNWSTLTSLKHTVHQDQSTDENRRQSDLLYAAKTEAKHGNNVELSFEHLLAKITVKLDLKNSMGISIEDFENASVSILGIKPEATFNSSTETASTSEVTARDIKAGTITKLTNSDLSSEAYDAGCAIVPLQTINAGTQLIKISLKNRIFIYKASEETTFQKGMEYTYTLTILGKQITGSLSVSEFSSEGDKPISFKDYFDYLADLKNRAYLGRSTDPHDLSYDYNGLMNTANCYVVTHPGYYKIPLVYGNAIKNGATNSIAYGVDENGNRKSNTFVDHSGTVIDNPYITSKYTANSASLVWQDAQNLVSNIALSSDKKYIQFEITKENIQQGNAVIAVKDEGGNIMWSWHIWVTNKNVYETVPVKNATGYTNNFMPIPLGWDDDIADKPNCTFYQWGRKDPFVGSDGTNITVCKTWYDNNGTKNTSILINDNSSDRNKAYSIKNPAYYLVSDDCWDLDIDTYDNWNGNLESDKIPSIPYNNDKVDKTIYDPNPAGYKMPTTNAFIFTNLGEDGEKNINACGSFNKGWNFYIGGENKEPIDFWAACGYRANNSNLTHVELRGYYWTSGLISSNLGIHLRFDNDMTVYCHGSSERAYGFAVRPVSE